MRRVTFAPPAGTYKRLVLSVDVTVGNFFPAQPDGKHLIFWFVKNKNRDMPGMIYFRGTGNPMVLVRWGIGLTHPQKYKMFNSQFVPIPGHTYRVVNDFDMALGVYTVTVTDTGTGAVVTLSDVPGVSQLGLIATDRLLVDQGFPEGVFDEVPSYGWTYGRMRLAAYR